MKNQPLAVRHYEFGKPEEVLKLEPLPAPEPVPGEVLIALRAAVIHPSDMGMIGGSYGKLRELPAVAGREGVGEVLAIGEGVTTVSPGRLVKIPEALGVWAQAACAPAEELIPIPDGVPLEQAAMAFVNPPTAFRLLKDYTTLQKGDWLIQNAGNSAVGTSVIQLARHLGYRTINVVRDIKWEPVLKEMGADIVVTEDSGFEKKITNLTQGAQPKLGLNSIGGESVIRLIRTMADSGTVVTFGGMVGDKVRFPTRNLIFNDLRLAGFWMDAWIRKHSRPEFCGMQQEVFDLIAKGVIVTPIHKTFPFEDALAAVHCANTCSRQGKVLITSEWRR